MPIAKKIRAWAKETEILHILYHGYTSPPANIIGCWRNKRKGVSKMGQLWPVLLQYLPDSLSAVSGPHSIFRKSELLEHRIARDFRVVALIHYHLVSTTFQDGFLAQKDNIFTTGPLIVVMSQKNTHYKTPLW
jgi:hypothetical protein